MGQLRFSFFIFWGQSPVALKRWGTVPASKSFVFVHKWEGSPGPTSIKMEIGNLYLFGGDIVNRLWAVVALTLLILTGCSSGSSSSAKDGETIYKENCSACHGDQLQGAVGPPVVNMKGKHSEEEVLKIISEGTPKMPGNLLGDEESKIVTKWLMEK
jgi:cytochrome c551